jgi:pimeloyl-ACP methyl ester carboxylesterase
VYLSISSILRNALGALVLIAVLPLAATARVADSPTACVILLHGLWRTELSMKWLQWELEEAGYRTANPTYPSLRYPIEELAARGVGQGLEECAVHDPATIHFVTHSLGGILVRQYLSQRSIPELGRVVMLGPPNQGSQAADYVYSVDLLRPVTPEAVEQLGTGDRSIPRRLGPVNFELGVIAGTESSGGPLLATPAVASDGTVAVNETPVHGMVDFIELPVGHTFMMWNAEVRDQVIYFLRHGRFNHAEPPLGR